MAGGEGVEERLARVEERLVRVTDDTGEIKEAIKDIADTFKVLAILEEKYNNTKETLTRFFSAVERNTKRIDEIEKALPYLKLASSWVFKAVIGILGLLGLVAFGIVLKGGV